MAKKKETAKAVTYKVEFKSREFLPSLIATNFVIQRIEDNFKVSFYEIKPDIILSEEDRKKMEERGTLRADCVGSFIMTPKDFETLKNLMEEQLKKYEKYTEESKTTTSK